MSYLLLSRHEFAQVTHKLKLSELCNQRKTLSSTAFQNQGQNTQAKSATDRSVAIREERRLPQAVTSEHSQIAKLISQKQT